MSNRIKGIIDAVSEIAMDYSARMERAKEQGFDWADVSSREGIDYVNKAMRDGDPQAQAFSQYLSDNNIPFSPHVARTGSTYIDVLGDPYKLRDGGYSQSPLQYRFADHSKGKFGRDSYLGAKHIDSTMEADVFPGGNTLEQAIAKLEDTPGVRSRDAAFDPARRFDKNYLAGGAGLGILGGSMFASEDADAGILSRIKAFHGSPHDFDRFSSDNIGTGEGAQAYGHGLYFAEREPTAMSYRDSLTPRDVDYEEYLMDQYRIAESGQDYSRMDMLERAMQHDTPRDFRDIATDADYDDDYRQLAADMADEMEGFVSPSGNPVNFGHMYEVDIDARPEELLDFDAPLSQQSDKVKKVWGQWRASAAGKKVANEMPGNFEGDITGQEMHSLIYEGMTPDLQQQYGRGVAVKESIDAAQFLKDQGIKGIKYADAQTRFSPKGKTSNYVIFDDQLIDIAKKYGVSLPVAAAMFGSEETEAGPLTAGRRLIDPGFSVALGGGKPRVGLIDAIEQMPAGITPRAMDKGGEYDLYDFEGSPYILTQSDRSSAGGILESLYGTEIDPVDLRGGRDFMFDSPSEGMVWASDPKVTKGLFERAQKLEQDFGKPPLLLPYTMAPTGIDFATMPLDTMINFARASMAKKDIKALDKDIKKIIPEWKGVADPAANEIFRTVGGDPRKAVADLIDKKYRNVEGGLSIAEARAATTDASQYTGEMGDLANIGVFDTKRGLIADSGHPTYIGGIPGEGVGTLRDTINARELASDKGRTMKGDSSDIRSLSMNHELQQGVLDETLLRRLYDNKDKAAVVGASAAGPSLANASSAQSDADGTGLLGAIGDAALEAMSGVNRAAVDGVNFLTTDQINALLNLSGSDRRVPDLYDVPGVRSATVGNTMEPGLLRQIVRQGSEFISPI